MKKNVERINAAVKELQQGKMIILTDDAKRENEGDLIIPAEKITPDIINFMIRHCSGIICLSLNEDRLKRLNLPYMVPLAENTSAHTTPFTISIEAKHGVTTGVSAADRATTIQAAIADNASPDDIVRPGHIFPLRARTGGVLERAGHTEGSIDIVQIAGFKPAAVLCEIMNPDGTMAKGKQLEEFAKQHKLATLSIEDIITYRLSHQDIIEDSATALLPLEGYGDFQINIIKEKFSNKEHTILTKERVDPKKPYLVRIHSTCTTGDIFGSMRCDCRNQLHYSLQRISEEGGILIYLNQEGRGIGLFNKIKAYALQEEGFDTIDANYKLGWSVDLRKYYIAANVLRNLNIKHIRLLTNNPHKISDLNEYAEIKIDREPMPIFSNEHNKNYLLTKQTKLNHFIML